ncbi:hypothetical protein [Nostoc sp. NMS8]|uniref:hypothetical protein n=1 Tax=Nostoc sp. NMS8 TaxID=2815392 RepID=UPI0025E7E8DE|nr:hypothetical protein [Nostoc sp. NMS8]MBN3962041.1 hypothetical protein [Nostoc sp. NMS8]
MGEENTSPAQKGSEAPKFIYEKEKIFFTRQIVRSRSVAPWARKKASAIFEVPNFTCGVCSRTAPQPPPAFLLHKLNIIKI